MDTAGELPVYTKVAMEVEMDCFENATKRSTLKGGDESNRRLIHRAKNPRDYLMPYT